MTRATPAHPHEAPQVPHQPPHLVPPGFIWGVSTSSYQIEGAAREDGRGPSIWDTYSTQPGRIANGDTGDVACDHYHRYREDIALMRDLGVSAYRFSVAWPRVMPQGHGAVNPAGLAFYDRLVDALLDAGITPWLCLYHWDLPQALDDLGGWSNRDVAGWFADYATVIARRFGDRIRHFATFNESSVFSLLGYCIGGQAPGIASHPMLLRTIHHVNLAHGAAIDVLRAHVRDASLGIVHNYQPCLPSSDTPEHVAAAEKFAAYWDHAYPDPQILGAYPALLADVIAPYVEPGDLARICRPLDWFGLNHYSPLYVQPTDNPLGVGFGPMPPDVPRTANEWPMEPYAFRDTLLTVHERYRLPIYVTENGTAGADVLDSDGAVIDQPRIDFLKAYTAAMFAATKAGADVRGYFVWSLLDNFEWGAGYSQRFGITYVDYPTQQRTPKASFHWYASLIRDSGEASARSEPHVAQTSPAGR
jgi:beta-glucosidase